MGEGSSGSKGAEHNHDIRLGNRPRTDLTECLSSVAWCNNNVRNAGTLLNKLTNIGT